MHFIYQKGNTMAVLKTLTIAGSDTSGGAGLQADLKTFEEYKTYGLSAITCIVTMDPDQNWKHNVTPIAPELVAAQLKTILSGEPIQAMKTGMLGSVEIIKIAANAIKTHQLKNVVIDPVMICKGDDEVLQPDSAQAIRELLIPLATVATPNLFEAGQLSGLGTPKNLDEMKAAAKAIFELGVPHVVIKGGKTLAGDKAIDLYYDGAEFQFLEAKKDANNHNHGAGCTFAAAITGGLANGLSVKDAIYKAKDFVTAAIRGGFAFNQFIGPVWHGAYNQK